MIHIFLDMTVLNFLMVLLCILGEASVWVGIDDIGLYKRSCVMLFTDIIYVR